MKTLMNETPHLKLLLVIFQGPLDQQGHEAALGQR